MDTFVYELDGNLYINLTNKCSNACEFCVRNGKDSYYGNKLWLSREPSVKEVLSLITDVKKYKEIVFCGFGEPTYRVDALLEIARELKKLGAKTRINTNGQGNLINGRDITSSFKGLIDVVNVSLNESDKEKYQAVCHSVYGESAYDGLLQFAAECKNSGVKVVLSVVDSIGKNDVKKCQEIADKLGIELKVRAFIADS